MKRNIKDYLVIALKGIGMGAADVVPGVSGGTIAFITGIYEELVTSIKSINFSAVISLFKDGIKSFWQAVNGTFLFFLVAGILVSVLTLARLLEYILINHPILIWSFFFGLILASAVFVAKKIGRWNVQTGISMLVGAVAAFLITSISPAETTEAYWFIFLSGALAISAMILPGISGSFILLLLGKYQFILNAVNDGKFDILAVLIIGAVIGIISFANLLSWLLKRFHNLTIALLAGFMIGSLNKIWPWKMTVESYTDSHGELRPLVEQNVFPGRFSEVTRHDPQVLYAVLLMLAGIGIILLFELLSREKKA
jgi:putative membrane protein